jgi:hypothetical protein
MEAPRSYEEVLALAEALPPAHLAKLICELSRLLQKRHGRWTDLKDVEQVREYREWIRFRDSHHPDGRRKSPEEFLLELRADEGPPLAMTWETLECSFCTSVVTAEP